MGLERFGWNPFFDTHFRELGRKDLIPARVTREHKHLYLVHSELGELAAKVSGRMMHAANSRGDFPAVGDWVAIAPRPDEGKATIHTILPRQSVFRRKVALARTEEQVVAANIDTVFIVMGLDRDFNLRRLERYLTLAWESGAKPVVVLNKADLCADTESHMADAEAVGVGAPVLAISALEKTGLDQVKGYLSEGKTGALLGSSGVGKSTLVNSLLGEEALEVGEVRRSDGKGRHVTVTRQLVMLKSGGAMIDTPGMRELQLWVDGTGLSDSFDDIEELAAACRFRDCTHESEPGCAVKAAIESGEIPEDRFRSYVKLQKELALLSLRREERARLKEKQWKQIIKAHRQRQKHDPKLRR